MSSQRPNVLLIMCDELRHDCGGFANHPLVRTPNLDRLAENGIVFENAYCASPVCSPARASWLTGLYPHAHGQLVNYGPGRRLGRPGSEMRADCVTIGDVLKREGYRCGIVGPWHLGRDHQPQHGFTDFWRAYGYQGDNPDPWYEYLEREKVPDIYKVAAIRDEVLHMKYTTLTDPRQQRTTWTIDRGLEFLDGQDQRPFFLFLSIKDPHPPIFVVPELVEMYPVDRIELPPTWADPLDGRPDYLRVEVGRLKPDVNEAAFKRMMAHYFALVTHIDLEVGRLIDRLRELDLFENTILAFISDHGEMLGDHGFTTKRVFYEGSVRVPCILSWPDGLPAGQRIRTPLGGVDLMPTLLELAGAELETTIDGRSVAAPVTSGHEPEPVPVFAEISTWQIIQAKSVDPAELAAQMMVRDGAWKYIRNRFDEDELYDLETDPHEIINLAGEPEQADRISDLQEKIRTMLARTGPGPYDWCLS